MWPSLVLPMQSLRIVAMVFVSLMPVCDEVNLKALD
jgi:hypothetical protein